MNNKLNDIEDEGLITGQMSDKRKFRYGCFNYIAGLILLPFMIMVYTSSCDKNIVNKFFELKHEELRIKLEIEKLKSN
ncbi:MAG: hypothetical protein M2R45_02070 [Verrucomicrobia subdivision 3 bacterium]|nr:hypothetical protein [Limisphaerales bacterium]MCS1413871.1 hypothetical protein [Limisphaerales bacterium]